MFIQEASPQIQSLIREPLLIDVAGQGALSRSKLKSGFGNDFICFEPGAKNYTLYFENDTLPENHSARNTVRVSSLNEAILFFGLLGDMCEMYFSPEYRSVPDERLNKLGEIKPAVASAMLNEADDKLLSSLLRKLPLDIPGLLKSPLAVKDDDDLPDAINTEFIHKKKAANALLSKPYFEGRLVYYNMLMHSEELRFDHSSDHVQGMLLLETMRQAGLATTHLLGNLPDDGAMTLMSYCTNFYNYIEHDIPVIVRAFTSYTIPETQKDKEGFVVCQVFQWGKLCAESTLGAVAFLGRDRYRRHRSISKKLSERNRKQFASRVGAWG